MPEEVELVRSPGASVTKAVAGSKVLVRDTLRQREWLLLYYTEGLGFWQYWDMFAPNPAQDDHWLDAEVEFADGSKRVVSYPRMYSMSIPEKFFKERYRKYTERLSFTGYHWKWPHAAMWFAARAWTDESNAPVKVTLRRHVYLLKALPAPADKTYTTTEFYSALIDQNTLREMTGR
jgi:hypothetical protein